jgi:hypothetical protein
MRSSAVIVGALLSVGALACTHAPRAVAGNLAAPPPGGAAACPTRGDHPGFDVPPRLRSLGALRLGDADRVALLGQRAVIEAMIDARGRPVPCTLRFLDGPDPRLRAAARAAMLGSFFAPATLKGEPGVAWIQQPFEVR